MKLSKKILLLFLLMGTFFLTACGIEVSTNLNLEKGFQGTRTISCFVSTQDMNRYFKGDITNIDAMIENNCPGCFSYYKEESSSGIYFIFKMSFETMDEYKSYVASLLDFGPEIHFTCTDSIFSNKFSLEENFTSTDLLGWFEDLLTEEYSIKSTKLQSLWDIKDTTVTWKNNSYTSESDQINIANQEHADFDGIEIYTTELDDRTFARTIIFKIPTKTWQTQSTHLKETFESLKPENADSEWTKTKTGQNFSITFDADDFLSLSNITNQIFMGKEQTPVSTSTFADYQVFKFSIERKETLDFSHFISGDEDQVSVSYYYKPNSMTSTSVEDIQKKINLSFDGATTDDNFYMIYKGSCSTLSVGYLGKMNLPVDSYQITTTLLDGENLEREFIFQFKDYFTEEEKDYLRTYFEKNNTSHLDMVMDTDGITGTLKILQSGSNEDLNYSSRLLFGSDDNSVSYERNSLIFAPYRDISMEEAIDLSRFLGDSNKEICGKYYFYEKSEENLNKFSITSDLCTITMENTNENDSYAATIEGCRFSAFYEGSGYNLAAILMWIVLFLILAIVLWLLIKRNPLTK